VVPEPRGDRLLFGRRVAENHGVAEKNQVGSRKRAGRIAQADLVGRDDDAVMIFGQGRESAERRQQDATVVENGRRGKPDGKDLRAS